MSIVDDPIDGGNAYEMYLTTESVDASVRPLGVASRCSRHAAHGAEVPSSTVHRTASESIEARLSFYL